MKIERPFLHENRARFESQVGFTAAASGFRPALIEKDYYCSLILDRLFPPDGGLVFKGGTCLGKVHLDFFRLSEDLDFCLHLPGGSGRSLRRRTIAPYKGVVIEISKEIPGLELTEPLSGRNESRQYVAVVSYSSVVGAGENTIAIEISLREPLLKVPVAGSLRTLLRDPFSGEDLLPALTVKSVDFREVMAEKFRAALTRLQPAIRDFFDVDYAVMNGSLDIEEIDFRRLVREKLAVPGTGPVDISDAKERLLKDQLESRLRPVLRQGDFNNFDLVRAVKLVRKLYDLSYSYEPE